MNNLLLAAVIVAGASVVWLGAHRQVAQARAAVAELEGERTAVVERANAAESVARKLEARIVEEKERAAALEEALVKLKAERPEELPAPTNPGEEGFWPAERPYFYLSKKHLEAVRYWPITDQDTISGAAGMLLGMTATERAQVNAAYARVREEMRELESSMAYPTNAPESLSQYKGEKISIFLPELPKEELEKIGANFRGRLAEAIGAERARLLATRIGETYDWGAFGMGVNRVITLIKDGDMWRIAVNAGGNFTMSHEAVPPGQKPTVQRNYAHLFPAESGGKPD